MCHLCVSCCDVTRQGVASRERGAQAMVGATRVVLVGARRRERVAVIDDDAKRITSLVGKAERLIVQDFLRAVLAVEDDFACTPSWCMWGLSANRGPPCQPSALHQH